MKESRNWKGCEHTMWVGKFKIKHKDWILDSTVKYKISATGIPLNSFVRNGKRYHTGFINVNGSVQSKAKFFKSLPNNKKIKQFEIKGNQLFVLVEGEDAIAHHFNPALFYVRPVLLQQGYEYWEIGSWDKQLLVDFYTKIKSIAKVELLKLKKETPLVFVQQAIPKLTIKQQQALNIALEGGYYSYPRQNSIQALAQITKISRTTLQEHLRKAETKIMRLFLQKAGI